MYERIYAGRAYVAKGVVEPVRTRVRELAIEYEIADRRKAPILPAPEVEAAVEQLSLFGFAPRREAVA
jgi:hypothetical protein